MSFCANKMQCILVLCFVFLSSVSVYSFNFSPKFKTIISTPASQYSNSNPFNPLNLQKSEQLNIKSESDSQVSTFRPWLPSFTTAALGGLLFGSDIGCSSSVTRIFGSGLADLGSVDAFQLGLVASTSLFGAMAASATLIFVGDNNIGRKLELQSASILFIIGTTIQSFAPSLSLMYLGRAVFGLGIGVAMHAAPLFIAETSPDNLRGKLVSYKEAAIVAGIVIGYGAGALFGGDDNWRSVFQAVYPLEALMLIGSFIVPESSRWLALRGRKDEAVIALQTAQGLSNKEATAQIDSMIQLSQKSKAAMTSPAVKEEDENVLTKIKEISSSPYNRRALLIGLGLVLFQQLSGQPSVLYFANRIFETAGLGYEAALGVGVFKLIMTLVSASLVENPKFGRKTLLLYGNIAITASLVSLSLLYSFAPVGLITQSAIIVSILVFVGGYQIGFGPITWLILSEIFPLRVRSAALSMGTLGNFASNLLVAGFFEIERQNLGEGLLFGQFAVIAAAAVWFTTQYVFETQGLSLEEIEAKLKTVVDGD